MIVRVEPHLSPEAELNGNSFVFLSLEYQLNSCLFSREWKGLAPLPLAVKMDGQLPLTPGSVQGGSCHCHLRRSLLWECRP